MKTIKDKEKLFELTNSMFNYCGEPDRLAEVIDGFIFDHLSLMCSGETVCNARF